MPNRSDKKATVYDVAAACGLSPATVSRVLSNNGYPVSQKSRDAILKAAKDLNYTPNLVGKALKSRQCRDIGIVIPTISNPYYATLLQGIYDRAAQSGYHTILCSSNRDAVTERDNIKMLVQKQVCGILLASISPDQEAARQAIGYGCKIVAVEQNISLSCTKVGFDFFKSGVLAASYLLDRGHTALGLIGAPLDRPSRVQLLEGFRSCLQSRGIALREEWIYLSPAEQDNTKQLFEFENGKKAAQWFADRTERPTGYVCINDMTAIGAMAQFRESGISVPEEASVIGFDNIPYAELCQPSLTTIDQSAYDMGNLAAKLLIQEAESPDQPHYTIALEPTLIERDSVRCLGENTPAFSSQTP